MRTLFDLLPEVYRSQDRAHNRTLEALLSVVELERSLLREQINSLYNDWFIETCDPAGLARLADRVGLVLPVRADANPDGLRRWIADATDRNHRRGTLAAAEEEVADLLGRPVELEVRHVPAADQSARSSEPRVEIHVFPHTVLQARNVEPCRVGPSAYTLSPLGVDLPLAPRPGSPDRRTGRVEQAMQALQLWIVEPGEPAPRPIPPHRLAVADLEYWSPRTVYPEPLGYVDPLRARLLLTGSTQPTAIFASFSYLAVGRIGGGAYGLDPLLQDDDAHRVYVVKNAPETLLNRPCCSNLDDAVRHLSQVHRGHIRILDSASYAVRRGVRVGSACRTDPDKCVSPSLTIDASPGETPCVEGDLRLYGVRDGAAVSIRGLWIKGRVRAEGTLAVRLEHCTIQSDARRSIESGCARSRVSVTLDACITGPVRMPRKTASLDIKDSIIDGREGHAVADVFLSTGPSLTATRSTLLGPALVERVIAASESIFSGPLTAADCAAGYLRYCAVSPGSQTPARFACFPENPAHAAEHARLDLFVSHQPGSPDYARPRFGAPAAVTRGAPDGRAVGPLRCHDFERLPPALTAAIDDCFPAGTQWRVLCSDA